MGTMGLIVVGFFWTSGARSLCARQRRPLRLLSRVQGGFYGSEPVMGAGPPLIVLIVCLIAPLLYSLPTALVSAELATHYPETGGQAVYVSLACGAAIGAHNTVRSAPPPLPRARARLPARSGGSLRRRSSMPLCTRNTSGTRFGQT